MVNIIADHAVSRVQDLARSSWLLTQTPWQHGRIWIACLAVWLACGAVAEAAGAPALPGPARRLQVGRPAAPARPYGYFPTQWSRWPWQPAEIKPSRKESEPSEAGEETTEQPTPDQTETPGKLELPEEGEGLPAPPSDEEGLPPLELPDVFPPDEPPAEVPEGEPTPMPPSDLPAVPGTPPPPPLPEGNSAPPELPPDLAPPSDQTRYRYHRKAPLAPQLRPAIAGQDAQGDRAIEKSREKANRVVSVWQGFDPDRHRTAVRHAGVRPVPRAALSASAAPGGRFSTSTKPTIEATRDRNRLRSTGPDLPGLHDPRQLRVNPRSTSRPVSPEGVVPTAWNTSATGATTSAPRNPLRSSHRLRPYGRANHDAPHAEPRRALRDNPLR